MFQQGHYQTGFMWTISFQLARVAWLGCSALCRNRAAERDGGKKDPFWSISSLQEQEPKMLTCAPNLSQNQILLSWKFSQAKVSGICPASCGDCCRMILLWTIQEHQTSCWRHHRDMERVHSCPSTSALPMESPRAVCQPVLKQRLCVCSDRARPPPR